MITHEACREQLSSLLDGEVAAAQAIDLRAHLADCPSCRGHLAELERVSRSLRALPRETMPDDLKAGVLRAARQAARRPPVPAWRGPFTLSSLAVAAAAMVVVAVVVRSGGGDLPLPSLTDAEKNAGSSQLEVNAPSINTQAAISVETKEKDAGATGNRDARQERPASPPPAAVAGRLAQDLDAPAKDSLAKQAQAGLADQMKLEESFAPVPEQISEGAQAAPARYAAMMVESPDSVIMLTNLTPLADPAPPGSRADDAGRSAGLKRDNEEPSASRERASADQKARPSSAAAAAPSEPQKMGYLSLSSLEPLELRARLDARGVILDIKAIDPSRIDPQRAEQIRLLLVGRELPGLAPGARTAIIELSIQKQGS